VKRPPRSRGKRLRERIAPPPGTDPDGIVLTFPVAREHAGQRLDRYLQSRIPRLSRTRARAIVEASAVRPDGTRRRASDLVRAGEVVILVRARFEEPTVPLDFGVVYEDDAILAVDKPAGLPMHPTATYHRHTLTYLLRERYGDGGPQIAHRLDRETSGLVLCARTLPVERRLKEMFAGREVHKTYLAIVRGVVETDEGTIDAPLAPSREGLHVMMEVRDDGPTSEARTRYRVLARLPGHTAVALDPETGRQHQLRVHLASIGHAIVGDKLYGPEGAAIFVEHIDGGMTEALRARAGHDRQALHAWAVRFEHPVRSATLTLQAPVPKDLADLWSRLGGGNLLQLAPEDR
jgi:23S rRNA pseudouridine1911/1915/1917 synthase